MIEVPKLACYLDEMLHVSEIEDYCPNGIQISGKSSIAKIVTGVTACRAFLEKAVSEKADAVIVHHGLFWKGEPQSLVGFRAERVKIAMCHDLVVFAYHLPLDMHRTYGNNAQLGRLLGIESSNCFKLCCGHWLGWLGELPQAVDGPQLARTIEAGLNRKPLYIPGAHNDIKRVAWCTGAAQDLIEDAVYAGADAFITGEASERTVHVARESGIHFYAAGHHATERLGVQALGEHLKETFDVDTMFIDIDNPV